jgi:hypothetical protein
MAVLMVAPLPGRSIARSPPLITIHSGEESELWQGTVSIRRAGVNLQFQEGRTVIPAESIQFDSLPTDVATTEALPDARLLNQFRGWLAQTPHESRQTARTYVAWLGWWRRVDEFFATTARLSSISRGGALVFLPHPPAAAHPVRICLGTTVPDECPAATTLGIRNARRGECMVRLAFREPCPTRFLEVAVRGLSSNRPRLRPV